MKHLFALPLFVCMLVSACTTNPTPTAQPTEEVSNTLNPPPVAESTIPVETPAEAEEPVSNERVKVAYVKNEDGNKHVQVTISEETIDSLNHIVPILDKTQHNQLTIDYFSALSESLHGRPFYVSSAKAVSTTIMEILSTRINEGSDIVFLIDKTASMDDDIASIKSSLHQIMNYLSNFDKVKVGIACYGDLNYHYQLWFDHVDLTRNYEKLADFLDNIQTIGNPDDAESVNDGIVRTVESMHWTPGNRRMMLVIGDAPSQLPPYSRYDNNEVIKKCSEMNVLFNLYPVVISNKATFKSAAIIYKDFVKVGPNPASEFITFTFSVDGTYSYEINDLMGNKVLNGMAKYPDFTVPLDAIPTGKYLLQVIGRGGLFYYSTPLVISH